MKRSFPRRRQVGIALGLLLLLVVPFRAGDGPEFRFTCDGAVRYKAKFGETHWSGEIAMEHPMFRLTADGEVNSFTGPRIRIKPGRAGKGMSGKRVATEREWISLVAVGEVRVTFRPPGGEVRHLDATRVVYLPREARLLVDGVSYACSDLGTGPREGGRGLDI